MSPWIDRILKEFPADLARLWIAADPDDVLLDEQVLSGLRERGFELLPFEDSVAFRAEYEERYRGLGPWRSRARPRPWSCICAAEPVDLPWDYLRQARRVSLSLANLFPKLSYPVVRQIGAEHQRRLFAAQAKHASQALGESATKEFVLTHIFRISPHLISRPEDLWRELLRLHYQDAALPPLLADHVARPGKHSPGSRVFRSASCSPRKAHCCGSCRTLGTATCRQGLRARASRSRRPTLPQTGTRRRSRCRLNTLMFAG